MSAGKSQTLPSLEEKMDRESDQPIYSPLLVWLRKRREKPKTQYDLR